MASPKIAVIYYSMYGHIRGMAHAAVEGAKAKGATVTLLQFAETLPQEVIAKMHGGPKDESVPIVKPNDLTEFDGYIFCFPTRYGRAVAQVSAFFDSTGGLWGTQALNGKMATIITSTGTQHGGQGERPKQPPPPLLPLLYLPHHLSLQYSMKYILTHCNRTETTVLTTLPYLAHHGIIFVPLGYADKNLTQMNEIMGGSPWGAATLAASDGCEHPLLLFPPYLLEESYANPPTPTLARQPSKIELDMANFHAGHFANTVKKYVS
ncbi:hypothetical protein FS842_010364 [Serendipita sp. 407]|nr:hypothetical protein FS842_010364 [Serendipita sp. 407]